MEHWKDITDYEGLYEVSCRGNVRNKKTLKLLSNKSKSYVFISLVKNKFRKTHLAHRIVALMFIPNPLNKKEVNHINGVKNDNRVENLEWCTSKENISHSWRIGTSSMTEGKRRAVKELWALGTQVMFLKKPVLDKSTGKVYPSRICLSKEMNISESTVRYRIKKGFYESIENV